MITFHEKILFFASGDATTENNVFVKFQSDSTLFINEFPSNENLLRDIASSSRTLRCLRAKS